MKKYQTINSIAGILAVVCYLVFTIIAYSQYPLPYSPTSNWLSDLGNPNLNPQGATFYNIGIISTAVLLMMFFLGLSVWKIEDKRVQIIMLRLAQGFGILGSICMIMSAIFPNAFVLEWITLLLFLGCVSLVGVETRRQDYGYQNIRNKKV